MNPYFRPPPPRGGHHEERPIPPQRGYGLIDEVEWDADQNLAFYALDIVDGDWMD